MITRGRRSQTRIPGNEPEPRKKLALKKKTVRDLELRGEASGVKGGNSGSGRVGGGSSGNSG